MNIVAVCEHHNPIKSSCGLNDYFSTLVQSGRV